MLNEEDFKKVINTIIQGDSIKNLSKIPNESVDLVFADPPYWMQTEGELLRVNGEKFKGVIDAWDKFSSYAEYDEFSRKWLNECKRILKPNGSIWVIGSFQNIYRLGYIMQNLGFWILNDVIWSKPNAVPNFSGTRFQNSHETLIWCTKKQKSKYTFNYKTMKYLNNGKQEKSVWDIGICIGKERIKDKDGKKAHSTQKPEQLLYKIILSTSRPNDIILDPFFGTGTTGAIAKKLGRNFIGIEKEAKYVKIARDRIDSIEVENSEINSLSLETKPPKVSTKQLIDGGYLKIGEKLYDKNNKLIGTLTPEGYVFDGKDTLSIHKMSAKHLNISNNNGWDYFYYKTNDEIKAINSLRYIFGENNGRKS